MDKKRQEQWKKFLETGNIIYYINYKQLLEKEKNNYETDIEVSRISLKDKGL